MQIFTVIFSLKFFSILNKPAHIQTSHLIGDVLNSGIKFFHRNAQIMVFRQSQDGFLHKASIHLLYISVHFIIYLSIPLRVDDRKGRLCHHFRHVQITSVSCIAHKTRPCHKCQQDSAPFYNQFFHYNLQSASVSPMHFILTTFYSPVNTSADQNDSCSFSFS